MKTAVLMRLRVSAAALIAAISLVAASPPVAQSSPSSDSAPTTRRFGGMEQSSHYVTMHDGVRIAIDVHLPKGLKRGERTATILHLSRYYRSLDIKTMWRAFFGPGLYTVTERDTRERMVKAGYSWIDADVRGTGASFGRWGYPLPPLEISDGSELIDWVIKQPWSAGVVGATGDSYDASLAIMQLAHQHRALKAVVTRFGAWDMYEDVFVPGGLQATSFVSGYAKLLASFDRNELGSVFGWAAGGMVRGVRPVDRKLLPMAQTERARNANLEELLKPIWFRDDPLFQGQRWTVDDASPHKLVGNQARVPVYTYSGWLDGALSRGQIAQFLATRNPGSRLRMGPWFHASFENDSPYKQSGQWPDHGTEFQRFFDQHLRGIDTGISNEQPIQYFMMGAEQWRGADAWPPPGSSSRSFYFAAGRSLANAPSTETDAADNYAIDDEYDSGGGRWGIEIGTGHKHEYGDRREYSARLLGYTSAPLVAPLEVTGEPRVEIYLHANAVDGGVFVYLEDVAPDGRVRYVTEGQLRLAHRALPRTFTREHAMPMTSAIQMIAFDLLPTSYRFPAGHSVRVTISGADRGSFATPHHSGTLIYSVHHDAAHPSRLLVPEAGFSR